MSLPYPTLSGEMPLDDAVTPIKQVLVVCGLNTPAAANNDFTLNQFNAAFNKLPIAQQQALLPKLKALLPTTP